MNLKVRDSSSFSPNGQPCRKPLLACVQEEVSDRGPPRPQPEMDRSTEGPAAPRVAFGILRKDSSAHNYSSMDIGGRGGAKKPVQTPQAMYSFDVVFDRVHAREVTIGSILGAAFVTFFIYQASTVIVDNQQSESLKKHLHNPGFKFAWALCVCSGSAGLAGIMTYGNRVDVPLAGMGIVSVVCVLLVAVLRVFCSLPVIGDALDGNFTKGLTQRVVMDAAFVRAVMIFLVGVAVMAAYRVVLALMIERGELASHDAANLKRRESYVRKRLRRNVASEPTVQYDPSELGGGNVSSLASVSGLSGGDLSSLASVSSLSCSLHPQHASGLPFDLDVRSFGGFALDPGWKLEVTYVFFFLFKLVITLHRGLILSFLRQTTLGRCLSQ